MAGSQASLERFYQLAVNWRSWTRSDVQPTAWRADAVKDERFDGPNRADERRVIASSSVIRSVANALFVGGRNQLMVAKFTS
ncbi:hypothetical protein B5V01_27005 [Mesorhizobium erdmanii]|uniref:Uncharacterized protein n=2 Tax=Mesorhizobium TaxID=68287 RepID=A0A3M9WZS3_9HYPH|nr:hypothetical protein DNR46_34590 [Mesorhizobium japonicum]RXT38137.1 hypothetical protein B5V01_27005 [Mesorhizobium erdmanii]